MLDNLARQQAAYLKMHGVPMPPLLHAHTLATMIVLQSLYFEDSQCESRPELSCESFYKSIAPNSSIDPQSLSRSLSRTVAAREERLHAPCGTALKDITEFGYSIGHLPPPQVADICDELAAIQSQLSRAGLPPPVCVCARRRLAAAGPHVGQTAAGDIIGDNSVMEVRTSEF